MCTLVVVVDGSLCRVLKLAQARQLSLIVITYSKSIFVDVFCIVVGNLHRIAQSCFLCILAVVCVWRKLNLVAVALGCNDSQSRVGCKLFGNCELKLVRHCLVLAFAVVHFEAHSSGAFFDDYALSYFCVAVACGLGRAVHIVECILSNVAALSHRIYTLLFIAASSVGAQNGLYAVLDELNGWCLAAVRRHLCKSLVNHRLCHS